MRRLRNVLSFIFLLFLSLQALALSDDGKKAMHIMADSSTFNYKTGSNTYEGNVKIDQGTTHLIADRLVTSNNDKHKMQEAIAYGLIKNAEYTTLTKPNGPVFHATAKIIKFYPLKSNVVLEGDVIVTQGENSFHGPVILYNIKDQIVNAPASNRGRATIVIEPGQLKL